MTIEEGDLLSTTQVARLLDCSENAVRQMANRGDLDCEVTPIGRLFHRASVEALRTERTKT